jgi:single-strand DNA-binding protein
MSQIGYVTLTGYVASEPKLYFTKNNEVPIASVRVGSTPRRVDRATGEWRDGDTSYFTVKCWRKLAMNARASLHKGDPIIVRGKFRTRTWADEDRTRTEVEIEADSIGHDLSFGWSHFNRGAHARPGAIQDLAQGEAIRQMVADEVPDLPADNSADLSGYPDDYAGESDGLPGDEGDGDPGAGMTAGRPDGPLASRDTLEHAGQGEPSGERAFAESESEPAPL